MKSKFKSLFVLALLFYCFTSCKKQIDPMETGRVLFHETNGDFYFLSIINPDTSSYIEYQKDYKTFQYTYSYDNFKYVISYYKDASAKSDLQRIQDEIHKINDKLIEVKNLSFKKIGGIEFQVDGINSFKKRIYCTNVYVFELTVSTENPRLGSNFDDPNINAFFNSFYLNNQKAIELIKEDSLYHLVINSTNSNNIIKEKRTNNSPKCSSVLGQRIDESYSKVKTDLVNSNQDIKDGVEDGLKYLYYGGYGKDGSIAINRYNFNKKNICVSVIFSTNSRELINKIITNYDANYKKINPDKHFLKTWIDPFDVKSSYTEEMIKGKKFYYCYQYK